MEINWVTFIAQIVNFLILLFLLWRFLYHPILKAMKARENKIASSLDDARQTREKAQKEIEEYTSKKKELDDMREELAARIRQEVEATRRELMKKAREDVEAAHQRWMKSLAEKEKAFLGEVRKKTTRQVYEISRRALQSLADTSLEQSILSMFLRRFQDMPDQKLKPMKDSVSQSDNKIMILSSFEIPEPNRQKILKIISSRISSKARTEFILQPDLICGVKIKSEDREISWSLDAYLETLEQSLGEAFDEELRREHNPEKQTDDKQEENQ